MKITNSLIKLILGFSLLIPAMVYAAKCDNNKLIITNNSSYVVPLHLQATTGRVGYTENTNIAYPIMTSLKPVETKTFYVHTARNSRGSAGAKVDFGDGLIFYYNLDDYYGFGKSCRNNSKEETKQHGIAPYYKITSTRHGLDISYVIEDVK